MDRLDQMRLFARVAERLSFSLAAQDLGVPASTATDAVKQLEARLGVRLLERTTRKVGLTPEGDAYYRRCLSILDDVENAEGAFGGAAPKGVLRIDVQGRLARRFLLPSLPRFFAQYPGLELKMSEGDRFVDLIREGVDCVLRVGELADSEMVARRIAVLAEVTCAAPSYIERFGLPERWDRLDGHRMIGFHSSATGTVLPLEFQVGGVLKTVRLPSVLSVNAAESYGAAARLGLGIIQVPRWGVEDAFADGSLVPLLEDTPPLPMPVSLLYPKSRQLTPRVRVFIDWVVKEFKAVTP
jgi:DNA-binding transcriptional LysR family regulator